MFVFILLAHCGVGFQVCLVGGSLSCLSSASVSRASGPCLSSVAGFSLARLVRGLGSLLLLVAASCCGGVSFRVFFVAAVEDGVVPASQYVHLGVEQYSFVWPVSPQIVHMYGRWFVDVLPPRPLPLPRDGIAEAVVPLVVLAWDPLLDASYWVA